MNITSFSSLMLYVNLDPKCYSHPICNWYLQSFLRWLAKEESLTIFFLFSIHWYFLVNVIYCTNQFIDECKVTFSLFDLKSENEIKSTYITVLKLSQSNVYFYITYTLQQKVKLDIEVFPIRSIHYNIVFES